MFQIVYMMREEVNTKQRQANWEHRMKKKYILDLLAHMWLLFNSIACGTDGC